MNSNVLPQDLTHGYELAVIGSRPALISDQKESVW
jgi:hypothetical protein